MTDPKIAQAYLEGEVVALEPFGFLGIAPAGNPLYVVEVTRREDGVLAVQIPGRPRPISELEAGVLSRLRERGFASEDPADQTKPWAQLVDNAEAAVSLVQQVLLEVYEEKPNGQLDLNHGSHRAAHEAEQKLTATRAQIEQTLVGMVDGPLVRDDDDYYVVHC